MGKWLLDLVMGAELAPLGGKGEAARATMRQKMERDASTFSVGIERAEFTF
jgi:hypothetical protein